MGSALQAPASLADNILVLLAERRMQRSDQHGRHVANGHVTVAHDPRQATPKQKRHHIRHGTRYHTRHGQPQRFRFPFVQLDAT